MILTEDKTYTISLETEDNSSDSVLINKTIELEFSNKELLHSIITCGMPIQRLTALYPEKRRMEVIYKLFLVETALETEGDRLKKAKSCLSGFFGEKCDFLLYGDVSDKDDQQSLVRC